MLVCAPNVICLSFSPFEVTLTPNSFSSFSSSTPFMPHLERSNVPICEFSPSNVATFRHPMQCLPQQVTHYLADALCSLPVHVHVVECSRQLEDGSYQVVRSCFCFDFYIQKFFPLLTAHFQVVVIPFCQRLEIGPHISPASRGLFYELREDKVASTNTQTFFHEAIPPPIFFTP